MSKNKPERGAFPYAAAGLFAADHEPGKTRGNEALSHITRYRLPVAAAAVCCLIALGVMAKNGWLPRTDPLSGAKTGWFGKELSPGASSVWNPFAAPPPSPTPQLSKEYIYAGSKLLAVEDVNANAAPPADLALWRSSTGIWYVLTSTEGLKQTQLTFQWGISTDVAAVGDYDGDGKTDFSIYRPSETKWYIGYSSDTSYHYPVFGASGDIPAPGAQRRSALTKA